MASTKSMSRSSKSGKPKSAVAAAAYRAAEKIVDNRTGLTHDYTKKKGVVSADIILPSLLKESGASINRGDLWNLAESSEKRIDARVAREWLIALPSELNEQERQDLAHQFAQTLADRYGTIADCCIHEPTKSEIERGADPRNFHAHIMFTTRTAELDQDNKIILTDKATIELSDTARGKLGLKRISHEIKEVRQLWEEIANAKLAQQGHDLIDSRSYKAQGIDIIPQLKIGAIDTAAQRDADYEKRKNTPTDEPVTAAEPVTFRHEMNRLIAERNAKTWGAEIAANQKINDAADQIIFKKRADNDYNLRWSSDKIEWSNKNIEWAAKRFEQLKQRLDDSQQVASSDNQQITSRASSPAPNPYTARVRARKRASDSIDEQTKDFDRLAERANQITAKPVIIDNRLEIPTTRGAFLTNDKGAILHGDMHRLHDDFVTRIERGLDAREQYKAFMDKTWDVAMNADFMVKKNPFAEDLISSSYELLDKVEQLIDNASKYADDANYSKEPHISATSSLDRARLSVLEKYKVNYMTPPDNAPVAPQSPSIERDNSPSPSP